MVHDIEVLDKPADNFWTSEASLVPDNDFANVHPGEKGFKQVPINTMLPRSFFTNVRANATLRPGQPTLVRGIAFGGVHALQQVQFSADGGKTWAAAKLGQDYGRYSFRQWQTAGSLPPPGKQVFMVRSGDTPAPSHPGGPNLGAAGFLGHITLSPS